ncbi:zinc finger protein 184-like isoform X2 [Cheilinus undulatus]|uniref:zinc finger protein 184-like isoform X2 n=1 Tax=Cheilinus undulatus TaxID=241271 RepID=UPI001BD27021|nr:zinc finger protein 184-like isoform X2 [Cheilinus undulatus]
MQEIITDSGFPPLSSLRLIVPPLQLVSAALLEIVKQGAVMYFGLLEEFISTVLETAPELLTDTERVQLVIGLRAKVVLELCRGDTFANQQAFQLHLDELNTYITNKDKEDIFPTVFGPKYDLALQALMKKFLFNLQVLLPVPDFEQTSLWLSLSPSVTKECADFMNQSKPLKTLIQHQKQQGHTVPQALSPSYDDCILSSLSYDLPNLVDNSSHAFDRSEPICDFQDWRTNNLLSCELTYEQEEDGSEFEMNVEEDGHDCVNDLDEEKVASVEVTVPPFDETESNRRDRIDKKCLYPLKTSLRSSAKNIKSHVGVKDFSPICIKLQKHKITQSACIAKTMSPTDSASQSSSCEKFSFHPKPGTSSENESSSDEAELSLFASDTTHNPAHQKSFENSELPNDDCSLVCHVCAKVFACQKNFDEHQRICATRSKQKEEANPQSSTNSALHTEAQSVDIIDTSFHFETQNVEPLEFIPTDSLQDQACKRSSRIRQCSICREIFPSSTDLMRHMQCHYEPGAHLCSHCGEEFESYKSCKAHEAKCTASNQNLKDRSMSTESEINQEVTMISGEINEIPKTEKSACAPTLTCPECGMGFAHQTSYNEHQKNCSEAASKNQNLTNADDVIVIDGCDFFAFHKASESHADKSSEINNCQTAAPSTADNAAGSKVKIRTFRCTMCEETFSTILVMQQHYSESHDVRSPYPCTLCNKTFLRLCELVRHQKNKKLFLCPTCKQGFRRPEEVKQHEKEHRETTPFTCDTCGENFTVCTDLILHKKKHREPPPNDCSYCGKKFGSRKTLKAHMVRHTDGFPCPVCGKVFFQKSYLNYHLYKHTGQEPYLCDTCGKGWPTPAQLKIHIVTHREDRPFKCEDCGVAYKRESHLVTHQRSRHGSSRPHVCEVCGMAFRLNSKLKIHMMVHTGERPFSCPICGKTYKTKFELKKHREKPCL